MLMNTGKSMHSLWKDEKSPALKQSKMAHLQNQEVEYVQVLLRSSF
jgi:hypothetical protein